ncbi:nucleotide sugar dehydrogenase [Neptuniibacter sp. SY11_33]|uniref:nucleotide sugar dehydrogenase n=1 Tax=Neptuniibacter sp. SY11_33 TaxID=3398215 RepID=UPI0039F58EE1
MTSVAVMGMGYVGLTLSVALAKKGFNVIGVEKNFAVLAQLKEGIPHFTEKGLAPLLRHYVKVGKIRLSQNLMDVGKVDTYIISVGTPLHKSSKKPNTDYIGQVLEEVGGHVQQGALIALRSTVAVGTSRRIAIPEIEKNSGLKVGEGFSFAFVPERTIEGNAIQELEKNPQVIGGFDEASIQKASQMFAKLTPTILSVSSLEAAEMVKLMDNSYRDLRFSYANQVAQICESMGLDANELIDCANTHYPRNSIPVPSPGVGGACLSKDPYILADAAKKAGADASLLLEGRRINEEIVADIVNRIAARLQVIKKPMDQVTIGIAGLAFKGQPETSDLRESTSIWLLEQFSANYPEALIKVYDPVISDTELETLGFEVSASLEQLASGADVLMLMNNHASYTEIDPYMITSKMRQPCLFYDAWRMLEKNMFDELDNVEYLGVGV